MDLGSISSTGLGSLRLDDIRSGGSFVNSDAGNNGLPSFGEVLKDAVSKNAVPQSAVSDVASSGANSEPGKPGFSAGPAVAAASGSCVTIDRDSELFKQCLDLETFLVKNLVTSMRGTVQKSGLVEQGFAGEMYEDMLYDEYSKEFTKNANFGMADLAYLELTGQRGMVLQR